MLTRDEVIVSLYDDLFNMRCLLLYLSVENQRLKQRLEEIKAAVNHNEPKARAAKA